jgi:hypothetical protein
MFAQRRKLFLRCQPSNCQTLQTLCSCWYLFMVLVGVRFSVPIQTDSRAYTASYTIGTRSLLGVKRPGHGIDHPPHLAPRLTLSWPAEHICPAGHERVKERVELNLYSPLWAFVACSRVHFNLMGTGSFPGVKLPGCGVEHPPPSSAEVEGRVQLYICSPCGPSWPVLGWNLCYFTW